MSNSLYDSDFYAWANQQAALMRAERLDLSTLETIALPLKVTRAA